MAAKKIAISVPEDVLDQVDRAASQRGLTRSGFITEVLRRVAAARADAEVRRRVDELFSDPDVAEEQRETARAIATALPPESAW
jgi:metal-responsive CopG/Arc/MetJ family transcriptional regulator